MTKIELNYWNFKKNANLSPFYDNLEVKKSLNFDLSKRIEKNTRGLEFICKISGLLCQEPALFKCFWSLICDNLTISDQNNSFELAAIQNN